MIYEFYDFMIYQPKKDLYKYISCSLSDIILFVFLLFNITFYGTWNRYKFYFEQISCFINIDESKLIPLNNCKIRQLI